ncbi:MAG TPA: DNA polymerase III subunit gamma/tau [Vicinamibacterales bacterium]|nr:DNA polymerase III subunit gamma/tau [Vicinamibacterales bacterium]
MSYQVIARKWRPQKFDDVVGQTAVTRTLRNALASGRLAQAFVFAGPRGVGKTTTARILARALNCVKGPTADPCGECDACIEIAEGRDMDVLEIDAATHTGIDNVREVIVSGLSIAPVRNRYKIFIIDEVHQLSIQSFNALLKSIEEPPPHVVFMMATTELEKIPETVLSRAQAYEFRAIGSKAIADQLRKIVDEEKIAVPDEALQLIARDADGSMRDAETKLDQVIAFTGNTITVDDVGTVLALVGRDLLLDAVQAVADENAPAAFQLAARAVEMGYDLRAVCRELSRVVRDLLVISVDPSRANDPEIAGEGERDRVTDLASRFSREDLLRAFDLLTKAEAEIRNAAQPRYHLEMALLRWIYVRKMVSIEDLIAGSGAPMAPKAPLAPKAPSAPVAPRAPVAPKAPAAPVAPSAPSAPAGNLKDALLAEIRKQKVVFYNTIVAQAQKIEVSGDKVTFTFSPNHRTLRAAFEEKRSWLESVAQQAVGRRITIVSTQGDASSTSTVGAATADKPAETAEKKTALRDKAMADSGVQTMLEVFPAEIRDVEEM